jgi:hypothetical protein
MEVIVYYTVDVRALGGQQIETVRACNELLEPHEHAPDCPVRHGASVDCVWPIAVCYSARFSGVFNVERAPPAVSPEQLKLSDLSEHRIVHSVLPCPECAKLPHVAPQYVACENPLCTRRFPSAISVALWNKSVSEGSTTCLSCGRIGLSPTDGRKCSACRNASGED